MKQKELNEFFGKEDKSHHIKATLPLFGAHGSKDSATVYFRIQGGDHQGRHTDSTEELLFILEGDVEVEIGGETSKVSGPTLALVPGMVPHDVMNTGQRQAKVMGFFRGTNHIVVTFQEELVPIGSKVVDTSKLF